jgi:hypothetical protein
MSHTIATMVEALDRDFIMNVLRRMEKPSGMPVSESTVTNYTKRILTLKNRDLLRFLADPEALYATLKERSDVADNIIVGLRPAMSFFGRLTPDERAHLGVVGNPKSVLPIYARLLTFETARKAAENRAKKKESINEP